MYKLKDISFSYGRKVILDNISLDVEQGTFVVLLGRNGSGKSTLLKCFSGSLPTNNGVIYYHEHSINEMSPLQRAHERSVLSQSISVSFPFSVLSIVEMGLYHHDYHEKEKQEIAVSYLGKVGLIEYKDDLIQNLSGGQQQRVHIARILCQLHEQKNKLIFVDEPTTALDISYQIHMLNLLKEYKKQHNHSIFCILHDVNLALLFADKIAVLDKGKIIYMEENNPHSVKPILEDIYDIPLNILPNDNHFHIALKAEESV